MGVTAYPELQLAKSELDFDNSDNMEIKQLPNYKPLGYAAGNKLTS